jgi:DNA-binding transcriptional MerR regulator
MDRADSPYTLADLARAADVTPRTVRYYVAQGLLPPPAGAGRGPHWDGGHLARLRLIRSLQDRHLPLAEIRRQMASMSAADVAEAARMVRAANAASTEGSALDYIRTVLETTMSPVEAPDSPATPRFSQLAAPRSPSIPPPPSTPNAPRSAGRIGRWFESLPRRDHEAAPSDLDAEPAVTVAALSLSPHPAAQPREATGSSEPMPAERSQWDRIALSPDVELHVRRPLSRPDNRRVERLIGLARQILKGGS